jgi:hypothetical protein
LPAPLAVPLGQISRSTQLGRIAVDFALIAVALLTILAAAKARGKALWLLSGYVCFLPFIVWWDPFDSKWFFIPNLFLAGFFSCAWAPWLKHRAVASFIFASVLFIAATNFVTTIRPRHNSLGSERLIAQCVGANMEAKDLLLAPEWGWPDYLEYLHGRQSLSLISHFSILDQVLAEVRGTGGKVYMPDPKSYSEDHLAWLKSQAEIRREDLSRLSGAPAFSCYGRTILSVPN